jgi:hypothetical protein
MINKIIFLAAFLSVASTECRAQQEYSFEIRIWNSTGVSQPAAHFEMKFNRLDRKANANGVIYFTRPVGTTILQLETTDKDYSILGSTNIPYPENPTIPVQITIHRKTDVEAAGNEVMRRLKNANMDLGEIKTSINFFNKESKQLLDSILLIVTKEYKIPEEEIRGAAELLHQKDKYFNEISILLEGFLNEVKDVRDIFKHMTESILENPKSFHLLDSTVRAYNYFYSELNSKNNEYEKAVEIFWRSQELALSFHNVFDYAINNVHRTSILPLNEKVMVQMRSYIREPNKRNRKSMRDELLIRLDIIIPVLDNGVTVLETKIRYLIGRLIAQKELVTNKP